MKTYTIPVHSIDDFEKYVNKFKKKFQQFGDGVITLEYSQPYVAEEKPFKGTKVVDVTIDANYQIKGYDFIAELDYNSSTGENIIRKNPSMEDVDIPKEFYARAECDHCHAPRARIHTILLRNSDTNEFIQVGTSCVKDYLGVDLGQYARLFTFPEELDNWLSSSFYGESSRQSFDTDLVVAVAAAQIDKDGYYKSVSNYGYTDSTKQLVIDELYDPQLNVSSKYKDFARDALEKLKQTEDTSEFLHNLIIIAKSRYIDGSLIGFACYIPVWYAKQLEKEEQTKQRDQETEAKKNSEFLGSIGDKLQFKATPRLLATWDTQYGTTFMYEFVTDDGNVLIWKASNPLQDDSRKGVYQGTVKDHQEYKGVKQTVIQRCKFLHEGDKAQMSRNIKNETLKKVTEKIGKNPFENLHNNIIDFDDGDYYYIGYEDGKMFAGDSTNTGIIKEFILDYDETESVEANIERLYDYISENRDTLELSNDYEDSKINEDSSVDFNEEDIKNVEYKGVSIQHFPYTMKYKDEEEFIDGWIILSPYYIQNKDGKKTYMPLYPEDKYGNVLDFKSEEDAKNYIDTYIIPKKGKIKIKYGDEAHFELNEETLKESTSRDFVKAIKKVLFDELGYSISDISTMRSNSYEVLVDFQEPVDLEELNKIKKYIMTERNPLCSSVYAGYQYDDGTFDEIHFVAGDEAHHLEEDTVKQNGKWVNKGKEGTHGKFKTKKAADAQRRAMFANGYKEDYEQRPKRNPNTTDKFRIEFDDLNDVYQIKNLTKNKYLKKTFKKEAAAELFLDTADMELLDFDESLKCRPNWKNIKEGTVKTSSGKEDIQGKFRTIKEADAQRKAMFANGYKESLKEDSEQDINRDQLVQLEIELYQFLNDHQIYPEDGTFNKGKSTDLELNLVIEGDWKHDHLYAEDLVNEFCEKHNLIVNRHTKQEIGNSESDWYRAEHKWKINKGATAESIEKHKRENLTKEEALRHTTESYDDTFSEEPINLFKYYKK